MKDWAACLVLLMLFSWETWTLEAGIDKGILECSREKGNDILYAEKGDHGYIVSGGFPGNYSTGGKSELWCQVHIQVCSTCRMYLSFEELSFASCLSAWQGDQRSPSKGWCHQDCDHIHVHEVDPPYNKVTHRDYFLDNQGDHYISISGHMKVQHCAGNTSLEDGRRFKIAYRVIDKTELHKGVASDFSDSKGVVTSPNFPRGYAINGETFTFMIQNLDPYGFVRVTFDDWDIAPESKVTVYEGFTENSPHITLERYTRPIILSQSNTLVIVLFTGTRVSECCYHTGFKARFHFVSEQEWTERPDASCSEAHPMQGGGIISFTGAMSSEPTFYDCVWLIKRYSSLSTAEAVVLRLREVLLGDGWLQFGKRNTLEIRKGISSEAPLLARFTTRNLTDIPLAYFSQEGLYLRLRGGFYSTDKLSFTYTAVKNVTGVGEGCPGYFDFLCQNLLCIDQELMCDGVDHCGDGSDEHPSVDCSVSGLWKHSFKWSMPYIEDTTPGNKPVCSGILCGKTCLSFDQICDGVVDCADRVDEDSCVKQPRRSNAGEKWVAGYWTTLLFAVWGQFWSLTVFTTSR